MSIRHFRLSIDLTMFHASEGGMSKYLVMFKVNIWFSLLDFPTSGKYYNDNVILLRSLRILQKDQMLKLLISNMQSVCFVNKHI